MFRFQNINLKFPFPFYGHLIYSVLISTGGFLYLGEFIHFRLAATQYIAPLMANFDFSASNYSNIYYVNNQTMFAITWSNVTLQERPEAGGFTFQTTLHPNGTIIFGYKNIPIRITEIASNKTPVVIGTSDAYTREKTTFCT